MVKKTLSLVILQSLVVGTIALASPTTDVNEDKTTNINDDQAVVQVDKCPSIVKLTNKLVKYIGNDKNGNLFLDSEGYRVNPCKGKEDNVYFFKVDKYPDGKKLFDESKNEVLNGSYYDNAINFNIDDGYKITYGSKHYEITDVQDFQHQLQKETLNIDNNEKNSAQDIDVDEKKEMKKFYKFNEDFYHKIPDDHINDIDEEKQEIINQNLPLVLDIINGSIDSLEKEDRESTQAMAVKNNRILNPNNNIISLYTSDDMLASQEDLDNPNPSEGKIYGEIQGNLYLLYNSSGAKIRYLKACKEFVLDDIANPQLSLDEKFSLIYNLSKQDNLSVFLNQAEEYKNSLTDYWGNNLKKLQTMNPEGLRKYNETSENEKIAFNKFIESVNREIIKREYNDLPQQLNKKQYKALSNIDKYKYAPKKEGDFIDKNLYEKNPLDLVLKYHLTNTHE